MANACQEATVSWMPTGAVCGRDAASERTEMIHSESREALPYPEPFGDSGFIALGILPRTVLFDSTRARRLIGSQA